MLKEMLKDLEYVKDELVLAQNRLEEKREYDMTKDLLNIEGLITSCLVRLKQVLGEDYGVADE